MKYYFSLILFLSIFFIESVDAQKNKINLKKQADSLLNIAKNYPKEDTVKLHLYEDLYRTYIKLDQSKEVSLYIDKTIHLAAKLNQKIFIGKAYLRIGFYHHSYSRYLIAEEYYLKSIDEFTKLNDIYWIASVYQNMSAMYINIPDYVKALDANFKAVELFSSNKDEASVAGCYVNIASIYKSLDQNSSAIQYLEKALILFKKYKGNDYGIALSYANLGAAYFSINKQELKKIGLSYGEQFEKSLQALDLALKFAEHTNYYGLIGSIFLTRGNVYNALDKDELALSFYQKSIDSYSKATAAKEKAESLMALVNFHIKHNEDEKARPLLKEVLQVAEENKILGLQRDSYLVLNKIAEKEGNYEEALKFYKKYIFYNEQIFNQEKEKEITRKQLQLDFSIKERDYQSKQEFQRKTTLFLSLFVLILLAIALWIYKMQRKTAKLNQLVSVQKEELEKIGKVKDKIFSVVSHDMRTPVNSLISFIQLLEMGNISSEKLKRYADSLKNSLNYTSSMMENLLNWAYSQMEGFKPKIKQFKVQLVLSNLITAMQEQALQKNIQLHYIDDNNATMLADKDMFLLVIRNLLSNAIKFSPINEVITIKIHAEKGHTLIKIIDNGVGFEQNDISIFNEAAQLSINKTTLGTNQEKGTGIGLLLCKSFVALMNGKLQLESQTGKGSCFTIILPNLSTAK